MNRIRFVRAALVMVLLGLSVLASPAFAQMGSLKGRVVDADGKPVPDVEVVLDYIGDMKRQLKVKTDKKGEWIRAGVPAGGGGRWTISVTKGDLVGRIQDVEVALGNVQNTPDIVLKPGKLSAPVNVSKEEAERASKRSAELEKSFSEAKAAIEAGNFDEAIAKLTALTAEVEKCGACYIRLGDAYAKKKDLASAEKAYLKVIEIDPNAPDSYNALATIYNEQKRFDDAAKMSAKGVELSGAAGGGGDANALYNAGVIAWNSGKGPEAAVQFQKAAAANPKMADAHYMLGLSLFSLGKSAEAKGPLQEYLKLAPTGTNAETVKQLLATIK
jgi:tetratricopeptide (TPR) repeat protein